MWSLAAAILVLFKMAEFDVPGVGQEDDVTLPRGTGIKVK